MLEREGKDSENIIWSQPTLPKFYVKKGPLDFIEKMWKSECRNVTATLAVYPKSKVIDIGPYIIDLYKYLKTELWDNWLKRTKSPRNSRDIYFCYASNSTYKPRDYHFTNFSEDITPEGIA